MNFNERPLADTPENKEEQAEKRLEKLIEEHPFLENVEMTREAIENASTAEAALAIAEQKVRERIERSTDLQEFELIEGVNLRNVDRLALYRQVKNILKNHEEIGRGKNAFVIIDKSGIKELPSEICYKFLLTGRKEKGLLTPQEEAEMQNIFFEAVRNIKNSHFSVPTPFYSLNIDKHRLIAMEKLNAVSFEDLARGKGVIPDWFDVDAFCENLKSTLDSLHATGLYHRDLHEGNLMLSQDPNLDKEGKWGYIIDFGHSAVGMDDDTAYKSERLGAVFTFSDDYGIIEKVRKIIKAKKGEKL